MMKMKPSSLLVLSLLLVLGLTEAQNEPKDFLNLQNAARAEVGVGPFTWDTILEEYAKKYAELRSKDCKLIHSGGPYGENLYWGKGVGVNDATKAVQSWVNEKSDYDYNTNSCSSGKQCGCYTQIVWRNSTQLGCARVKCSADDTAAFITCNYNPPGNYVGEKPY